MDTREIRFIVSNSPPFNKLKKRQANRLINICEVKDYRSGEVIYKEADPPDYFYFLLKGRIVVSANVGLKDSAIEILKRGTCFGIISLLTQDAHSVTAKSIEISSVLRVEKGEFKEFLKNNPLLFLDFSRLLSQRVKARSKPKRIFQSKKIGIMGDVSAGKTTYMYDLGLKLKEQAKKDIICIQIVSPSKDINSSDKMLFCTDSSKVEILALKNFREESLPDYIIKGKIDRLCIKRDAGGSFLSLLNFLSESYHFILYEIPHDFLKKSLDELIEPAHQLHFLLFPQEQELKRGALLLKELKNKNPLNKEKVKVILVDFLSQPGLSFEKKRKLINFPIYATLPFLGHQDYPKVLRRIARQIGEVILGVALGSGGAYGFSHIGVLKALERNNIALDIVCGTSTGAIIAALWAVGFNFKDIEKLANEFGRKMGSFSIMGFSIPFRGIMRAKRLESIFKSIFKDLTFYDLKHELKIVAFDFRRRKTVILEEGFLYKAVAASCAFPGIFGPVKFKKDILLDGGVLNPLPTKVLLKYNVFKIIASNISLSREQILSEYKKKDKFHIFDFIFGSIETMQQQFIQQALKIADVVVHPNLEGLGWMEFARIAEFIQRGEEAALGKIEEIKKLAAS